MKLFSTVIAALFVASVASGAFAQTAEPPKQNDTAKPSQAVPAKAAKKKKADVKKRGVKTGKKGAKECEGSGGYCQ